MKIKGSNKEGTAYTIAMSMAPRLADNRLTAIKDGTTAGDSAWLDTIDAIPTT